MRERQSGDLKANPCRWRRSGSSLMPRGSPKAGEAGRRQREEQGMME